jgi:amino acid transporter
MGSSGLFRVKPVSRILHDATTRDGRDSGLRRNLSVTDLTALGIAAVIGAGIFSTIGNAASTGGPAVSLLFLFTAMACGFSALCYARFASVIPVSGSAYTYAYASFGELIAWIIGWDLIMEYAIGNIAVAISWSDYFTGFLGGIGIHLPDYLGIDYLSASRGYQQALLEFSRGMTIGDLPEAIRTAYQAWTTAPSLGGLRLIADIPAFGIVVLISVLVYVGIYETKVAGNTMVILKVGILLLIIAVGAFYVDPENWSPFAPNGLPGVLKGVSGVFFAYIGFDAISTTAEECRNPQRDLPRAIVLALIITTVLYILISLVLTGMVQYSELAVGDPLAFAFHKLHLTKFSGLIAISAVIAMASVLLVFQVGQPRIWMSMSRDGLLPPSFSKIHPKYKTPWFSTIIAGVLVAIPSLFMNLTEVTDLTSIGTLFAFILVSGGVLIMDKGGQRGAAGKKAAGFRIPYLNCRYYLPLLFTGCCLVAGFFYLNDWIAEIRSSGYSLTEQIGGYLLHDPVHHLPMTVFLVTTIILSVFAIIKEFSLIPVLGLLTNLYLMAQLGTTNWMRFLIWLLIGLLIYFAYGRRHSLLHKKT